MRIGLQTWGSHGDVAPFIALAAGLSARGHRVTLAVTTSGSVDYADKAAAGDFELRMIHSSLADPPPDELRRIVETTNRLEEIRLLNEYYFDPVLDEIFAASQALCAENDIVVGHFWLHPLLTAAELAGVPRVAVHFCPIGVRSAYVPADGPNLGPWLNGLVWDLGDLLTSRTLFRTANALRVRLGLEPVRSLQRQLFISSDLTLIGASPLLCPRPPDWPDSIQITGHFDTRSSAARGEYPESLRRFVDAGEPPVFCTFGSCDLFYGADNVALFREAAELAGVRAIVQTLSPLPEGDDDGRSIFVNEADHPRVFRHCSAIVHHGGAGTTHTTIAAGKPAVIVAHGFDQSYWGRAAANAGIAVPPLHRRSVSPRRLAKALRRLLDDPHYAAEAARAAESFATESGVERAAELIEDRFS